MEEEEEYDISSSFEDEECDGAHGSKGQILGYSVEVSFFLQEQRYSLSVFDSLILRLSLLGPATEICAVFLYIDLVSTFSCYFN